MQEVVLSLLFMLAPRSLCVTARGRLARELTNSATTCNEAFLSLVTEQFGNKAYLQTAYSKTLETWNRTDHYLWRLLYASTITIRLLPRLQILTCTTEITRKLRSTTAAEAPDK